MSEKIEISESFTKRDFVRILRELAEALESSQSFAIYLKEQVISIPSTGEMKIEYELKGDKGEVDLELSWKATA